MNVRYVHGMLLLVLLEACALGDVRDTHRIRRTQGPDAAMTLDMAVTDQGIAELTSPPDRSQRQMLVVFHPTAWADGFRAQLIPPQTAPSEAFSLLQALPGIGVLVPWDGPDSEGQDLLASCLSRGVKAAPLYVVNRPGNNMGDDEFASLVGSRINWLVSHVTDLEPVLNYEGRPVIALRLEPELIWLVAFVQSHLASLGRSIHLFVQFTGSFAEQGATPNLSFISPCHENVQDEVYEDYFICAAPQANQRLSDETARVRRPDESTFAKTVRWARRKMDTASGLLMVDGLGAFRNDRQLDPIVGASTQEPESLTAGYEYSPHGESRWNIIRSMMEPAGSLPTDWVQRGQMVEIERTNDVVVSSATYADGVYRIDLRNPGGEGFAEFVIDDRPFVIPDGVFLKYRRSDSAVRIQLRFSDGRRLSSLALPMGEEISIDLGPFVGLRVEETTLEYVGGFLEITAEVASIRMER